MYADQIPRLSHKKNTGKTHIFPKGLQTFIKSTDNKGALVFIQATNNDISKLLKSRKFNRGGTAILAYLENSCDDSRNMTQRNLSEKINFDVES